MMNNERAPAATEAINQNTKCYLNDNSSKAQRIKLLRALRCGGVSTIQARRDLDIMMPGARIFELRHKEGHEIITVWTTEETEAGNPHRVAYYVLKARSTENALEAAKVAEQSEREGLLILGQRLEGLT